MRVIILGSAAGGGVPQWNCACPNCTDARHDNRGRTQSSVARRPPRYARGTSPSTFDVGLRLEDERTGGTLAYVPTAGAIDDPVRRVASGADLLLFDGTFWSDDELRAVGGGDAPTAREMG